MNRIVFLSTALALTLGASAAMAAERGPSASRGRTLFMTVGCNHCHGTQGQGSGSATRLTPDSMPAETLAQFIRGTNTRMPPYSADVLNDRDVADIAAYLASVPAPKSPDSIAALKDLKPTP